jgi:hypothetical protein
MKISQCFGRKSVNIYYGCCKLFRFCITHSVLKDSSAATSIAEFGGLNLMILKKITLLIPETEEVISVFWLI